MKRLILLVCVAVAGCAPIPPAPPEPPAAYRPAAVRHERTVIDSTTPIYGGLSAERAVGNPPGR